MLLRSKKVSNKNKLFASVATALGMLTVFASAHAATTTTANLAPLLPASVDPARVMQAINPPPQTKATAQVSVPGFSPQPVSAAAQKIQFTLQQLVVTGGTVYGNDALAAMFHNYIGQRVSLADLQQMADQITLRYRQDGYVLTRAIIPAQQIHGGVANIRVIEGFIGQVDIEGDAKGARPRLEAYGEQLKRARPLNIKQLERYALLANDIPGMSIQTVLSPAAVPTNVMAPGEIVPGEAKLTFIAEQSMAHGYASYDNRGTKYLGPQEYSLGGSVNSIFMSGDQTGLQGLMTTKTNELKYIKFYHNTPLGNDGLMLNIATDYSKTEPGYNLAPLDMDGHSETQSIGLTYPLLRSRAQNLTLHGGFDAMYSRTDVLGSTLLYNDRLRSLRFGTDYDLADKYSGIDQIGGQISHGLQILGASKNGADDLSRPDGKSDYSKINLNASRLQGLGHNFSLLAATEGQYAFTSLLSAEQFSFGGAQFGQAYDPSEIVGDHGLAGKVELRYDLYPAWQVMKNLQVFTFYDIGKVWNREQSSGVDMPASAASTGVGTRMNFTSYLMGTLEVAKPLTREVATMGNKAPRVFFGITIAGDTPTNTQNADSSINQLPNNLNSGTGLTPVAPVVVNRATTSTGTTQPTMQTVSTPASMNRSTTLASAANSSAEFSSATSAAPATSSTAMMSSTTSSSTSNTANSANTNANAIASTAAPAPQYPGLTATNSTGNNNDYYTIALKSSGDLTTLQTFAQNHDIADQVSYTESASHGKEVYSMNYGQYASSTDAKIAEQSLPDTLHGIKPAIKHITG